MRNNRCTEEFGERTSAVSEHLAPVCGFESKVFQLCCEGLNILGVYC